MGDEYGTKADLRRAVEKRLGKRLADAKWEKFKPEWDAPYDDLDLEEIHERFKGCDGTSTRSQPTKSLEAAQKQAFYESEERALSCRATVSEARSELFGSTAIPFPDLSSSSRWIRKLGEKERPKPVDFENVDFGSCLTCGAPALFEPSGSLIEQEESALLHWPYSEEAWREKGENVTFYDPRDEGDAVHVKLDGKLGTLYRYSRILSSRLECKETQATAYVLLGWIPMLSPIRYTVPMWAEEGLPRRIMIEFDLPIPDSLVLDTVKEARKELPGTGRQRVRASAKTAQKRVFLKRHDGKEYEAIRRRWNKAHPDEPIDDSQNLRRYKYK